MVVGSCWVVGFEGVIVGEEFEGGGVLVAVVGFLSF